MSASSLKPLLTPLLKGDTPATLKSLSLEELSQIEVTTPSKAPVSAFQTPAAIYVITGEGIRRSGATSIPELGVLVDRFNDMLDGIQLRDNNLRKAFLDRE